MNSLIKMKECYHYFYRQIQEGSVNKERFQAIFSQLEDAFEEVTEQARFDLSKKDENTVMHEAYTKEKLSLLEEKAKQQQPMGHIQEQTIQLARKMQHFCQKTGFLHIDKFTTEYMGVIEMELGISLSYYTFVTDKPVTAKKEIQKIKEQLKEDGFLFNTKETELMDCDTNKQKIKAWLLEHFPSARITAWSTRLENRKTQEHKLDTVKIRLVDAGEIWNIKTPQ